MSANTMAIAATYFMAAPRFGLLILDAGLPSSSTSANLIMRLGLGRERMVSARRSSLSAAGPTSPRYPGNGNYIFPVPLLAEISPWCWRRASNVAATHEIGSEQTIPYPGSKPSTPPLWMVGRDQGAALLRRFQPRITRPAPPV